MTNLSELREKAKRATKGEWKTGSWRDNIFGVIGDTWTRICRIKRNSDEATDENQDVRDAAYIVAAQPQVVIGMIDELEAKDRRIEALEKALASVATQADNAAWNIGKPGHKFTPADIQAGYFNIRDFARSTLTGGAQP